MTRLPTALRRFAADRAAGATVEFVLIFPTVLFVILAAVESGVLMTRYMTLDRAVDLAVRDIRLGLDPTAGHDAIRDRVCGYTTLIADCEETLVVELVAQDNAPAGFPNNAANCLDRSGTVDPVLTVKTGGGAAGEIMYMRVCALADPIMPGVGFGLLLPKDANGAHRMVTYTAFMNEPT